MIRIVIILTMLSSACHMKKETTASIDTDLTTINDIWALEKINGKTYQASDAKRTPLLEIHVNEMKYYGNDGCNNIAGDINSLTSSNIRFGAMVGTKMLCPDMKFSKTYSDALLETTSYRILNLKLSLFNQKGKELLIFKKVD